MTSPRRAPARWDRSPGAFLAAAALACVAMLLPFPVHAQTTDQLVNQRRLEYEAAKAEYDSALRAQRALEQQFGDALEGVRRARASGNADDLERANAHAQDVGIPYGAQEERVKNVLDSLNAARQELIEIIQVRLEELIEEADAASSAQERSRINAIGQDLYTELHGLEGEAAEGLRIQPIVMPEIKQDPRDGPADLLLKAGLLERRAATADTTILDIDRRVKSLNDRIRLRRQGRDMLANVERFDDTRLPVVAGQPGGDRPAAADSTSAGAVPLTLEEQVRLLQEWRQHLVNYRDQVLVRARQFRELVRSIA